eukprot:585530-Hanusia_phi.AAC.1
MKNTCKKLGVKWPTKRERSRIQEERKDDLEDIFVGSSRGNGAARPQDTNAGTNQPHMENEDGTAGQETSIDMAEVNMADQSPDEGHDDAARTNAEGSLVDAFFGARSADPARPELGIEGNDDSWRSNTVHEALEDVSCDPDNGFLIDHDELET